MIKTLYVMIAGVFVVAGCGYVEKRKDRAVRVNETWIQRSYIEQVFEALKQGMIETNPERVVFGNDDELRKKAAYQLVANQLLLEESRKRNVSCNPESLERMYLELKKQLGEEQYRQELVKAGKTDEEFKNYMADGMIVDSMLKVLLVGIDSITTEQVRDYYDNHKDKMLEPGAVRARHILLRLDSTATDERKARKRELAEKLVRRARAGEDFAKLARQHSEGPNAAQGGDVGWFSHGDFIKKIEDVAYSLKKNEISDIIETGLGFHIVQKSDERDSQPKSFDSVKRQIRLMLEFNNRSAYVQRYTDSLISRAEIVFVDTAYAFK